MHPAARASLLLAVAATSLATAYAPSWAAGEITPPIVANAPLDSAIEIAREAVARLQRWIVTGYAKRPAVMLGLGGVFVLPLLVLLGFLLYRSRSPREVFADTVTVGPGSLLAARIEVEGAGTVELSSDRNLVQIGRQDDNDICIRDETVSRYHAVIERSGEGSLTIIDVSSPDGGGLRINGEPMVQAVLSVGDMVELGKARMRVAAAL
jgi:hypothetical protein